MVSGRGERRADRLESSDVGGVVIAFTIVQRALGRGREGGSPEAASCWSSRPHGK
jgi:hypothetical protein